MHRHEQMKEQLDLENDRAVALTEAMGLLVCRLSSKKMVSYTPESSLSYAPYTCMFGMMLQ